MDMVNIHGAQEYNIKDCLEMEWDMEKDIGEKLMELQIVMKGNMLMIENVVMEGINGPVKICILDSFLMIKDKDMEKCIGKMEVFIKDTGKKGSSKEKEYYMLMDNY